MWVGGLKMCHMIRRMSCTSREPSYVITPSLTVRFREPEAFNLELEKS